MACWWRQIAVARGTTSGTGSWKRRVALGFVTQQPGLTGANWPRILATLGATRFQTTGSWTRRMTPTTQHASGPWAKKLKAVNGPL